MMKGLKFLGVLLLMFFQPAQAQFTLNGQAVSIGQDCYQLTSNSFNALGTAWSSSLVDLNQPFDLHFDIFLGCSNGGADGMTFGLQPVSTSAGVSGGGMGLQGVSPSIGVEFDTYQNGVNGDPWYDHMAIITNGVMNHNTASTLAGPVQTSPTNANVEDCQYHSIRVVWDPSTLLMEAYFDCTLRLSHTFATNPIQSIFGGNPMVYWGFTASTGGLSNEHRFCLLSNPFNPAAQSASICQGDSTQLNFATGSTYQWSTGYGLSDSTIGNPYFGPDSSMSYTVTVTDPCGFTWVDTANITVEDSLSLNLGPDAVICSGDSVMLDATQNTAATYSWINGSSDSIVYASTTGTYIANVASPSGVCQEQDVIYITVIDTPQVDLGNDTLLCDGDVLIQQVNADSAQYTWQDGTTLPAYVIDTSGVFWVEITNQCATVIDTIAVDSVPDLKLNLNPLVTLCTGDTFYADATNPGSTVTYNWSTGDTNAVLPITTSGSYTVTVTSTCQSITDQITLDFRMAPTVNLGNDTGVCFGDNITLSASFDTSTYVWSTGASSSTISVGTQGPYSVTVTNFCGTASDTLTIDSINVPVVNLGPDQVICEGEVVSFDASASTATNYQWSNGSSGPFLSVDTGGVFTVAASNNCGNGSDTVEVNYTPLPVVQLPDDTTICTGQSLAILPVLAFHDSLAWSTGSTANFITVNESGTYSLAVENRCARREDEVEVLIQEPFQIDLANTDTLCPGETTLVLGPVGYSQYLWSTGETTANIEVPAGEYQLTVTDASGCTSTDTLEVTNFCLQDFYAPNTFTPNGDGTNDAFRVYVRNTTFFELQVFNRWGEQVFISNQQDKGWDGIANGRPMRDGIYVWKVTYAGADRITKQRIGKVMLVHHI